MADPILTAVIDRIEDGVLTLVFDDETTRNLPAAEAPANARPGAVVTVQGGAILAVDEAATAARQARLRVRFDRLRRR